MGLKLLWDSTDRLWEANVTSRAIKRLTGMLEVGIFAVLNGVDVQALRT
jgi:ribose 5-phosphate isomerase A